MHINVATGAEHFCDMIEARLVAIKDSENNNHCSYPSTPNAFHASSQHGHHVQYYSSAAEPRLRLFYSIEWSTERL